MSEQNLFTDPSAAKYFMLAGCAHVTLVSKKTGARFTYRIKASEDELVHFVSVLSGPDNESSYAYMGVIREGTSWSRTTRSKISESAASHLAFAWAWNWLKNSRLPSELEIWHEGRCGRCGRKLTVPSSIESGIGPECARVRSREC